MPIRSARGVLSGRSSPPSSPSIANTSDAFGRSFTGEETIEQLKAAGFTEGQAEGVLVARQAPSSSTSKLAGSSAAYAASELREAGFTPQQLLEAGYKPDVLKEAGYTAADLRGIGMHGDLAPPTTLMAAGFGADAQSGDLFAPTNKASGMDVYATGLPTKVVAANQAVERAKISEENTLNRKHQEVAWEMTRRAIGKA